MALSGFADLTASPLSRAVFRCCQRWFNLGVTGNTFCAFSDSQPESDYSTIYTGALRGFHLTNVGGDKTCPSTRFYRHAPLLGEVIVRMYDEIECLPLAV
jgi:hypothetical protein